MKFYDEDEKIWKSSDYIREIWNSEYKNTIQYNYWLGIATGMAVSAVSYAFGFIYFLTK